MSKSWVEKYRPLWFDEVAGNSEIVKSLKSFKDRKDFPHLLFSGSAGIGKTTISHVFVNEIFKDLKPEEKIRRWVEFNASNKRGIDFVREEIVDFASKSNTLRVLILDEADELTSEAQDALKRTMELYVNCKFILTCNNKNKIITPILSRCACFDMLPLNDDDIKKYLISILEKEKIKQNEETINLVIKESKGDMRTAINQLYNRFVGLFNLDIQRNEQLLLKVTELIKYSLDKQFTNSINTMKDLIKNFSFKEIIYKIRDKAIDSEKLNPDMRYKIILLICEMEYRYNIGVSDYTLLSYFIAKIGEK